MSAIATPPAEDLPDEPGASASAPPPLPSVLMPEGRHGFAMTILATLAVIVALDWAQTLVISLLIGILFAYTLNPIVAWLERAGSARAPSAAIVMLGVVCALVIGTY